MVAGMPMTQREWWKTAVVYQIYPRSFAESATSPGPAPGVGTLAGLTERLDHLSWLGVDALWLSPIFRSPMADYGYDVSDYCDIDPTFGTLADFDHLLAQAHASGLRVLLDWVPNHTSDQHPWFLESRQDRTNPKADWYVWRDEPANNWHASFPRGERAWHYDEQRGQYYLRCFLKEQPDLNWDNPEVEAAMHDTLRFWLDRGVDGFRMDVVHLIGKDLGKDDPPEAEAKTLTHIIYNDEPITHERLRRIRGVLDSYQGDRTSVGEVYLLDESAMGGYLGTPEAPELHMAFNFRFLWARWNNDEILARLRDTLRVLTANDGWPTWALSNHDVPRHRQRYGGSELDARMAALMLLMLPGTPFLYQGEELGLLDAVVSADRVVDPGGRDGCRGPIPWDSTPLHGWATDPWLPFPPAADTDNVATQHSRPDSMLHWYHRLLALRSSTPALRAAGISADEFRLHAGSPGLLLWERNADGDSWYAFVNQSADEQRAVEVDQNAIIVLSTDPALEGTVVGSGPLPPRVAFVAHRPGTM